MSIAERARVAVNLEQYSQINLPEFVSKVNVSPPKEKKYILRMLIKEPFENFHVPRDLQWVKVLILTAYYHQVTRLKIKQPFCYLTIRHGFVESETDDDWHVDGFSMSITHLPEQNYIWSTPYPTEYISKKIVFPKGFDPLKHNLQSYIQKEIDMRRGNALKEKCLYALDPYVIHRRPLGTAGIWRTFVRISFTPIEIRDNNNTPNPLIWTPKYKRDGVKDFRNQLKNFEE